MTKMEAQERAEKIWGTDPKPIVTAAVGWKPLSESYGRIMTQWWVDVGRKAHSFDCNGHATCHDICAALEWEKCQ